MSQEIQLVNQGLPLQPALGPQTLGYANAPETTPLRRIHQLLRGRYLLAAVLAGIGAVCGATAGFLLPKPAFGSTAIIKIRPLLQTPKDYVLLPLYQSYLANAMVELHAERVIRRAMQDPAWKALRPYQGDYPPPGEVTAFSKSLTVKTMPYAPEMIQINYSDTRKDSRQVAQIAVNSVIAAFKSIWTDTESKDIDNKIQYQQKENSDIGLQIIADETAIHDLTAQGGDDDAIIAPLSTNLIALEQNLKEAQQMYSAAQRDRDRRKAGLNGAQPYNADEIARVDPQMLYRLNALNEARIAYESILAQYGQSYPRVVELKRLYDLRTQDIQQSVTAFNDQYFIEQHGDGTPGRAVPKDLSKLKSVVDGLQAEYDSEKQQVVGMLKRRSQIGAYKDDIEHQRADIAARASTLETLQFEKMMGGTFSIIDEGSIPQQSADRRPVFAALGFLGGAALPIGFLLLIGLANPRYRFSDETGAEMNGMNLLGILPDLPDRLSDPEQASIAAHCVHQIRTMLQISGAPVERRVFAITSAAPGDGKTSLTLALGLSYAACGARTLLIDCDLIGAGLTARMNVSTSAGVLEAIANRSLQDYTRATEVANVTILPVGTAQTLHASTLSPAALRRLIDEARKQYDTILIDTGPILGSIEASLVCAAADAVVLTVARGQQRPLVEKAIARLMGIGAKLSGVVFNRAQSGDFDRSISGASSLRSATAGSGHNGHEGTRYGTLGRAVHSSTRQSDINEG